MSDPAIQSGIIATDDLKLDLSVALPKGWNQVDTLLEERVYSKPHSIKDLLPKNKMLNFESNQTMSATNKALSQVQMEGTGLASVIQLVEGTGGVTLEQILEYRVKKECLPLFNVDDFLSHGTAAV